jgi:hypothetical protein
MLGLYSNQSMRMRRLRTLITGTQDPSAEAVLEIRKGLRKINPVAAQEFIRLYLEEPDEDEEQS